MDKVRTISALSGLNFRKWAASTRIKIILLVTFLMVYNYMYGIRRFTSSVGVAVTPWALVFLMTSFTSLIIIMLGFVFLYCDAPFLDQHQPYILLRTGRKTFIAGQILYIFASSFLYTFFVFLMTVLCCLPNLQFSTGWGKIFKTLAVTGIGSQFGISFSVPQILVQNDTPLAAMGEQILLLWLVGCFLGFLIFTFNLFLPRIYGIIFASLLVLLDMFADFYSISHGISGNMIYFFSPVSWANLNILKNRPNDILPSFSYVCTALIVLIIIFIVCITLLFRKKEIEISPQI